jgi:Beta-ketoacyl synthase, N-terminal domain
MDGLTAYVEGLGILGPGINNWPEGKAIFRDETAYQPHKTVYPQVASLPPTERRRASQVVKLALALGIEAAAHADQTPDNLPAVFASSGGDSPNCHAICEQLASDDRHISPTRFHNSVTNSPAGYWSIATGSMAPSTVICAFDGSFGAGLLEALAQVAVDDTRCLLIAYDVDYPEPLHSMRPIPDGFGVSLVLAPRRTPRSRFELQAALTQDAADNFANTALEDLRLSIPAARALPLMNVMAQGEGGRIVLDYLNTAQIALAVTPCA